MSKLKTFEIQLPHPGFYNSLYSDDIDSEESRFCEYQCEESEDGESIWPHELRLNEGELAEILYRVTSYDIAYRNYAKAYVDAFSSVVASALEISAPEMVRFYSWQDKRFKRQRRMVESLRLTYAAMESPREYNFTTDRVFANIPVSVIKKLWAICRADDFASLTFVSERRHSSQNGFISHYLTDWQSWGDLSEWDHNQLMTLLIAACDAKGFDADGDSDLAIYYATSDGESAYYAWESAVDWPEFESKRMESRAGKLKEWIETDSDAARNWIANNSEKSDSVIAADRDSFLAFDLESVGYRCTLTPDLFA